MLLGGNTSLSDLIIETIEITLQLFPFVQQGSNYLSHSNQKNVVLMEA